MTVSWVHNTSVSVCACLCVRQRASVVCAAAPKLCETAGWNECLLSKPCGSKLILVSDVNLRIELPCGVQAHADTWWRPGQSVRTCAGAGAFEWCCTCPFQMSQRGRLLRSRPWRVCLRGCVHIKITSAIKTSKHIVSTDVWPRVCTWKHAGARSQPQRAALPLNPILYSLVASFHIGTSANHRENSFHGAEHLKH